MIDLVLAGDNAVVIGLAAAGLPPERRGRAILVGIVAATVLRILFAGFAVELLRIVGLLLAGGILLLWVCWKMWRELRAPAHDGRRGGTGAAARRAAQDLRPGRLADRARRRFDVARQRAGGGGRRARPPGRAGVRPGLSILLMGVAANSSRGLLNRQRWIAYVGLAIILYVALDMIWRGALEMHAAFASD